MSWLRLHQWLVRPFALLLLSGALLWSCSVLFYDTDDGSFARELISSVIGTVLTLAAAGLVALFALRHRLASRREKPFERSGCRGIGNVPTPSASCSSISTQPTFWMLVSSCVSKTDDAWRTMGGQQ